jgi:hypothetical protein
MPPEKVELLQREADWLLLAAFRYTVGRQTAAVQIFEDILNQRYAFSSDMLQRIERELHEAIMLDEAQRTWALDGNSMTQGPLGAQYDLNHWYRIRAQIRTLIKSPEDADISVPEDAHHAGS